MVRDREKQKAYDKEYREKNREAISERNKEYYKEYQENNKEKIKGYYENNKEQIKEYYQTEAGKKTKRISKWKQRGVISDDYESLYNFYINSKNCEECKVELTVDRYATPTRRCLDHNHDTGEFRNVLCQSCNVKRK